MKQQPSILIVEDQMPVDTGIKNTLLESNEFSNIYQVNCVKTAIDIAQSNHVDLILMDLQLGDGLGVEACRTILDVFPKSKVLFLSCKDNKTSILSALLSGAIGYIYRNIEPQVLKQIISLAIKGFSIFNSKALYLLLDSSNPQKLISKTHKLEGLSNQQLKVTELVSQGLTNKEIAKKMNLSDNTIRNYLTIIFEKLGISKRTEAAVIYAALKS